MPRKQSFKERSPVKESPDRIRTETGAVDHELLLRILESAQTLRDHTEEGVDRETLIRHSGALFQDLLALAQSTKHSDPISKTQHFYSHNTSRSPSRVAVKGSFLKAQEEVADQLRVSVTALQVHNINELTQQLQIQIDRNNELINKYETLQKAFHTVSVVIHEELARCLLSIDDVVSLASDSAVLLKLQRDLGGFQNQIHGLFDKQGHYYAPIIEKSAETRVEFERQRTSWESSLSRQKESFVAEIKRLEEALRREESASKREREGAAQAIGRLEGELRFLANEKERLAAENDRLVSALREEKIACEEIKRERESSSQAAGRLEGELRFLANEKERLAAENDRLVSAIREEKIASEEIRREREGVAHKLEGELRFLANEKERLAVENDRLVSAIREEKIASEEMLRRIQQELDSEKQNAYQKEDQIRRLEKIVEERENTILDSTRQVNEWQKKCASVEQENLILERERETLRREKELLRDQIAQFEFNLKEASRRADSSDQRVRALETERNELERELSEKERKYQIEREKLTQELKQAQEEYEHYVDKTDATTNELKQSYERLIDDYLRQLDQQRAAFETFRAEKEAELKAKREDLRDMTSKYQSAEEQIHSLEMNLRKKDDKINSLTSERNAVQDKLSSLERQLRESSDAKDKSKKYFDMLTTANAENSNLKVDLQALEREKKDIALRYESAVRENDMLKEETERLRENLSRNTQKINEYLNESKALKMQLEVEHQNLIRKEKELKYFLFFQAI